MRYRDSLDSNNLAHHALEEYPRASGPSHYALFVDGIMEAKKVGVGVQNVLEQGQAVFRRGEPAVGNWKIRLAEVWRGANITRKPHCLWENNQMGNPDENI